MNVVSPHGARVLDRFTRAVGILLLVITVASSISCRHECVPVAGGEAVEATLRSDLREMRKAIDKYHGDRKTFPRELDDLVPDYLRKIPADPVSNRMDWRVVRDPSNHVIDVKSSAKGRTCSGDSYQEL